MAGARNPPGDGSALIVVLLLASLAIAGAVTWQAQDAARSHRAMAERVLRDYAGLAADELIRRGASEVGYHGYYVLIRALSAAGADPSAPPPSPDDLADSGNDRLRGAAPLARFVFRYRPADASLAVAGPRPSPAVDAWLRARLTAAETHLRDGESPMGFLHEVVDGAATTAVFAPLAAADAAEAPAAVDGFVVQRSALAAVFARVLAQGPLLPPSLGAGGAGAVTNDDLAVRVVDLAGRALYPPGAPAAGDRAADPYAPQLYATRPFGDAYGGNFEGTVAWVAIDPSAAPKLVIGGLPRSRLPLLLALLGLTTGLVATALFQLRRARRLTRLRADFVSRVSHELRTPLTQIRMFAETLRFGRIRSDAESRRALGIIDRESRRLSHLVENILQFSRGERGTLQLAPAVQPLAPLVREVIEELGPFFGSRDMRVRVDLGSGERDPVEAAVDAGAFRQILLNLLDNAVKYGPRGQEIRLELIGPEASGAGARRRALLAVDDQGPGVPPRDRERIWRSFHRLERERGKAVAGTGIGLAVVRELVERHGGRARVEAGPRGGARFVVELPSPAPAAPAAVPALEPEGTA